ncbi:hypothetical protein SAMN04488554_3251 [Ruania alba]|uniref:Uncharacterized protein n=1 Tax=Ruania alba TaxID=648782 RepID=A0A1H5M9W5_9MICO|nr:hypothetical protein SAMN04488554_3251 [Ruania alba]
MSKLSVLPGVTPETLCTTVLVPGSGWSSKYVNGLEPARYQLWTLTAEGTGAPLPSVHAESSTGYTGHDTGAAAAGVGMATTPTAPSPAPTRIPTPAPATARRSRSPHARARAPDRLVIGEPVRAATTNSLPLTAYLVSPRSGTGASVPQPVRVLQFSTLVPSCKRPSAERYFSATRCRRTPTSSSAPRPLKAGNAAGNTPACLRHRRNPGTRLNGDELIVLGALLIWSLRALAGRFLSPERAPTRHSSTALSSTIPSIRSSRRVRPG